MSADGITELAAVVAELGALPMPVPVVPEPVSAERLAGIAARAEAATAGPWWTDTLAEHDGSESVGIDAEGDIWIVPCQDLDPADAEFMAHARVDVPALLAEVRRQAALVAELEAERHSTNESLSKAAEQLRVDRDVFETARALCDAADYAGITSGGWFTVEAVRKTLGLTAPHDLPGGGS